jgi:hypothetical protein
MFTSHAACGKLLKTKCAAQVLLGRELKYLRSTQIIREEYDTGNRCQKCTRLKLF